MSMLKPSSSTHAERVKEMKAFSKGDLVAIYEMIYHQSAKTFREICNVHFHLSFTFALEFRWKLFTISYEFI